MLAAYQVQTSRFNGETAPFFGALPELAASKTLACSQHKLWSSVATAELTSRLAVAQQRARRTPTPVATAAGHRCCPGTSRLGSCASLP